MKIRYFVADLGVGSVALVLLISILCVWHLNAEDELPKPATPPDEQVSLAPPPEPPEPNEEKPPEIKFDQTVNPPVAPNVETAPPPESDAPMPLTNEPAPSNIEPIDVPAPQPEAAISPPPARVLESPAPAPSTAEVECVIPQVEVWRIDGTVPQKPARRALCTNLAYVVEGQSVTVLLRFDPAASGKIVTITAANGITIVSAETSMSVNAVGECSVSLRLDEGIRRGHVTFHCEGMQTKVPIVLASLAKVQAQEAATGG